jgi:hypothetical protein
LSKQTAASLLLRLNMLSAAFFFLFRSIRVIAGTATTAATQIPIMTVRVASVFSAAAWAAATAISASVLICFAIAYASAICHWLTRSAAESIEVLNSSASSPLSLAASPA